MYYKYKKYKMLYKYGGSKYNLDNQSIELKTTHSAAF